MVAQRENPSIKRLFRRVRLFSDDLATIMELMSYAGVPRKIQLDEWVCDDAADLSAVRQDTAKKLFVISHDFGLTVTVDPTYTSVRSTGPPTPEAYLAERRLAALLEPKQRMSIERVRLYACLIVWMSFTAILNGWIFASGVEYSGDAWTSPWFWVGTVFVGGVLGSGLTWVVGRFGPCDPIILDRVAWDSRGVLKKYGMEISIGLTALGVLVAVVVPILVG